MIRRRGPWRHLDDVEFAMLGRVAWNNTSRLLEPIGHVPPAESEAADYHLQATPATLAALNSPSLRKGRGSSRDDTDGA